MMDTSKVDRIRQQIGTAKRAVQDLRERRKNFAHELEEAAAHGADDQFAAFVTSGEIVTRTRAVPQIEADIAHVDALIAAGNSEIGSLNDQAKDAERAARAAWLDNLTMSDALLFAEETLAAIDVDAARSELGKIEVQIENLDKPRLDAALAAGEADQQAADLAKRYRGGHDPRTGLTPEAARAARADAFAVVDRLGASMRSLQRMHEQTREELVGGVVQAMAHVARLSATEAGKLEKYAAAIKGFASSIGSQTRPRLVALPEAVEADLPAPERMGALLATAEPMLALSRRAAPPGREEAAYAPRAAGR